MKFYEKVVIFIDRFLKLNMYTILSCSLTRRQIIFVVPLEITKYTMGKNWG